MAVCRTCGADLPAAARYCPRCGVRVATLADDERRVVTVVFADIAASTALGDDRDPEDARALIRPQLELMRDELSRHGGTIEKYVGDAVMAVFGAPVAHEDDAERAVRAALAIRNALGDGVRVAVNTGEAVVALGADPEAGEGYVAGDVVNTAFRIEEATPSGTVCVGESTRRATAGGIEYGERRLVDAKGKSEPLAVWVALRAPTEPRTSYGRALAPLVGRREELSLILETISRARRDRTVQLVTLVGPPGIGKSRLVWELERALEGEPTLVTWRRGRCLPYGDGVAYWALGEIVKTQAGVLESDDAGTADAKLAESVRQLFADGRDGSWVSAHLRPLLGLEAEGTERRDEAFAAWRRYFEVLAESRPLVLVVEDLHWADEGLLDFIEHAADWSRDAPIVLLCTSRPELLERRHDWGARANALTFALPPLSEQETGQLVSLLLRRRLPDAVRDTLLARAGGNPLYAEEFVRMLVDRGLAASALRADDVPLPESVQGIIASRLDVLASDEKALLQAAAVVGPTFWPGAVAAVAGGERGNVERALRDLERRELLREHRRSSVAGERQYAFTHVLVRDVAYGQIARTRRAEKHLRAAAWIESLGRAEDHAETVAHHYLVALEHARAFGEPTEPFAAGARRALRDAGERALALSAFPAATRYFAAALELWPRGHAGRAEVVFGHATAGSVAGAVDERALEAARDELLDDGNAELAAELESSLGLAASVRGDGQASLAHRRRAVELLADRPPSRSKVVVRSNLASALTLSGRTDEALEHARAALELATALGLEHERARALRTIGVCRTMSLDLGGLEDLEQSVEAARDAASHELPVSLVNLGGTLMALGDLANGFALMEEARVVAERLGDARMVRWLAAERCEQLYRAGELDECLALADELIAEIESGKPHYMEVALRLARGHVRIARGDVDAAIADAERACDAAAAVGDRQVLEPALAFRARAALEGGDRAEAARLVDDLLARLTPESVLVSWLAFPDLGVVLRALGRGEELRDWGKRSTIRTPWVDAAVAVAAGDAAEAARVYAAIGSRPDAEAAQTAAAPPP